MPATQQRATLVLDLFDLYYERVYAFLRKSAAPDVAEDLAQEVFLRLMQHPDLEQLEISISYLLKIAHNLLRRRFARASRLRELLEERVQRDGGDPELGPCRNERSSDEVGAGILETALGLLGRDEQDAIRLIVCEGKSYQHAAEALGVSVTTINNWKHRGIVKLRKFIEETPTAESEGLREKASTTQRPATRNHIRAERTPLQIETGSVLSDDARTEPNRLRSAIRWHSRRDEVA